jgi:hypothetical protein
MTGKLAISDSFWWLYTLCWIYHTTAQPH